MRVLLQRFPDCAVGKEALLQVKHATGMTVVINDLVMNMRHGSGFGATEPVSVAFDSVVLTTTTSTATGGVGGLTLRQPRVALRQ